MNKLIFLFVGVLAISGCWTFTLALLGIRFENKYFPMIEATPVATFFVTLGSLGLYLMVDALRLKTNQVAVVLVGFLFLLIAWIGLDMLLLQTYPRRSWN